MVRSSVVVEPVLDHLKSNLLYWLFAHGIHLRLIGFATTSHSNPSSTIFSPYTISFFVAQKNHSPFCRHVIVHWFRWGVHPATVNKGPFCFCRACEPMLHNREVFLWGDGKHKKKTINVLIGRTDLVIRRDDDFSLVISSSRKSGSFLLRDISVLFSDDDSIK